LGGVILPLSGLEINVFFDLALKGCQVKTKMSQKTQNISTEVLVQSD